MRLAAAALLLLALAGQALCCAPPPRSKRVAFIGGSVTPVDGNVTEEWVAGVQEAREDAGRRNPKPEEFRSHDHMHCDVKNDLVPPSWWGWSCQDQVNWGKCVEPWMLEGGYCEATCGRCTPTTFESAGLTAVAVQEEVTNLLPAFGAEREQTKAVVEPGPIAWDVVAANSSETLTLPGSCTELLMDGELKNDWVDCSFGSQSSTVVFASTELNKNSTAVAIDPDGAFSLCTRDPFGMVFNDLAIHMWVYASPDSYEFVQLELMYSIDADGLAYQTGESGGYDRSFSRYTVEDLKASETHTCDLLSDLPSIKQTVQNWTYVGKELEQGNEADNRRQQQPIYNRISLRNTNAEAIMLVIDSIALVQANDSSVTIAIGMKSDRPSCKSPTARLPPPRATELEVRSSLDKKNQVQDKRTVPVVVALSVLLLAVSGTIGGLLFIVHKRNMRNLYIPFKMLRFEDPPQVLGRGKHGFVLKAFYDDMQVATKLIYQGVTSSEKSGSVMSDAEPASHVAVHVKTMGRVNSIVQRMYKYQYAGNRVSLPSLPQDSIYKVYKVESINSTLSVSSVSGRSLLPHKSSSWRLKKSMERQAQRLIRASRHPNIVTVLGISLDPADLDYVLVMECVNRGSLVDCLMNQTICLEPELLLKIAQGICAGMFHLHSCDPPIIHNDLRAAKIFVDDNFTGKVGVCMKDKKADKDFHSDGRPWDAPELLDGSPASASSDVYSFGIVLIELFTRCVLHKDSNIPCLPLEAPDCVHSIVRDCLKHDAAKRPSFRDIKTRIQDYRSTLARSSSMIQTRNLIPMALPANVAEDLRMGRAPVPVTYDCLSLFMSDIVGYTEITAKLGPERVTDMLGGLYNKLDRLVTKHNLYKIETIGDAYIAVGGLLDANDPDHCARLLSFAKDAAAAAQGITVRSGTDVFRLDMRIGVHAGTCVGAVIGSLNPKFSLYGDAVNVVSRLESTGEAGQIHVSCDAADLLRRQRPDVFFERIQRRGRTKLKGKGTMVTYWFDQEHSG